MPRTLPAVSTALAAKRYAVEVGGCAVPSLGFRIKTDADSQGRIAAALLAVGAGAAPVTIPWKSANGAFHAITPADVPAIFGAAAAHVAAAFAREAELAAAIASAEDPEAVDISSGWPANG